MPIQIKNDDYFRVSINKFSQSFSKDHLKTFDISDGPLCASVSALCIGSEKIWSFL